MQFALRFGLHQLAICIAVCLAAAAGGVRPCNAMSNCNENPTTATHYAPAPLSPVSEKLLSASGLEGAELRLEDLGPECMAAFGRYDWQAYIPEEVRRVWADLPTEARLVARLCARQAAYWDDPPV